MKKIAIASFVLLFSAATVNAQSKTPAPAAKKPETKEKIKQAFKSKKGRAALVKLKENARKEGE